MPTQLRARPSAQLTTPASPTSVVVGADNLVGQTIGSYRVVGELGRGGMGCVYLAEHTLIGRKAAIKVMNPDIAADPDVVSRFFTEARAVNDIRHPNIVEVTDFGQFGTYYCIVMEYLDGETLAARQARVQTFDEPTVVRIMKQCTSALGAAHEQHLVHRDIKPENIFLRAHPDYPDFVKLLDFGIAKLLAPDSTVGHHTKTGSVMGTPSYMSPEQCLGEAALDCRSDIYSLGVVVYQMLTGQLPFIADTLGRLIVCHVNEPPVPPCVVNPAVSRPMNDVVLRALQKKPRDRHQSARELRDALEQCLAPRARPATPAFGVATGVRALAGARPTSGAPAPSSPRRTPATVVVQAGGRATASASAPQVSRPSLTPPANTLPPGVAASNVAQDVGARLGAIVLDRVAKGSVELPDLPGPTIRCLDLVAQGRLGFTDAANILDDSPAIRSRIMRLANSAAFPSLMPATTLGLAVGRLGTQGLVTALLEFAAHETLEGRAPRVKDQMRRIWPHALGVAVMTSDLCATFGQGNESANGYFAGLLLEVGRPVVGTLLIEIEQQMQRAGNRAPIPEAAYQRAIETAHAAVGGAVARHWELPGGVAEAVAHADGWNAHEPRALSNVVRFARILVLRLGIPFGAFNGAEVERTFGEGRALLRFDEVAHKRLSHGFKERINVLSGIRG